MAYIKNLEDLELDSYSHAELRGLIQRVMTQIGVTESFMLLHTLADLAGKHPTNMAMIAVRVHPDSPSDLELIAMTPPTGSIQHFHDNAIPMIGAMAMHQSEMLKTCAIKSGVGPYGAVEMLSSYILQRQKEQKDQQP